MLNKLFGSELRPRLLEKMLLSKEIIFLPASLARELKLPAATIRRELDNLQKLGLLLPAIIDTGLKKEMEAFSINSNFLILSELKSLFSKAQLFFVQDFYTKLTKLGKVQYFVLTGHFANNLRVITDMLIVGKLRKEKFLPLLADLEKNIGREIRFTLMDETEFEYRREVADIFIYTILNSEKIVIANELKDERL